MIFLIFHCFINRYTLYISIYLSEHLIYLKSLFCFFSPIKPEDYDWSTHFPTFFSSPEITHESSSPQSTSSTTEPLISSSSSSSSSAITTSKNSKRVEFADIGKNEIQKNI